jgi:hypothetical protein
MLPCIAELEGLVEGFGEPIIWPLIWPLIAEGLGEGDDMLSARAVPVTLTATAAASNTEERRIRETLLKTRGI